MENKPARTISIQLKEIIQPYVTALLKQLGVTINNWVTLYATCSSLKIRSEVAHYCTEHSTGQVSSAGRVSSTGHDIC